MKRTICFLFVLGIITSSPVFAREETRLLRFPAIHGDRIVFTFAGDLYTVGTGGGVARRLTGHEGFEMFARFSPDGKMIAFTGQYDGNTEVYVMPAEGGSPTRLTWTATLERDDVTDRMGPNNITMAWKHDNRTIVFRSRMRSFNDFNGSLFTVTLDGGLHEQIPVPRGGFCSFSPDDGTMAFNRIFREFRTWKRYRGGMADDIWIYDFETKSTRNITDNDASDIIPMWSGDRIYFLSDRGEAGRMNLYVYETGTEETRQLTDYRDFDVKFPSIGPEAIVYEYGGYIHRFDLAAETARKVPIRVAGDMLSGRDRLLPVEKYITNYEISPDGKRALFGARGDIFTVPAKHGAIRNLSGTSGVHERNPKWSPDGKRIAFVSDLTGEDEIYVMDQDGGSEPRQVTTGAGTYKYQVLWSPDSEKLLWSDRRHRLRYVDVETGEITEVDRADAWEIRDYAWSPDSRWIAYRRPEVRRMAKIFLYSLENGKRYPVTEELYESRSPSFDSEGRYLFFVSDRDFDPIYSWTEWNHAYRDMSRIYLVTLSKEAESPFRPRSDEVLADDEEKGEKKERDDTDKGAKRDAVPLTVDPEGLAQRIVALPIDPSSYSAVTSVGERIYYRRDGAGDEKSRLLMYDLETQEETDLGQIDGYEISADHGKMLVSQEDSYAIIELPSEEVNIEEKLDLSDMKVRLDRSAEWNQIFHESWRQLREFFYAPNMHGVDWEAVRQKYEPLVAHVRHRSDLTYIMGEMIGELNTGHTYVGGGDRPMPERIATGLLGTELEKDPQSGFFRITRILEGQSWDEDLVSPLEAIGVNAGEGDYIVAVDGKPTSAMPNIYESLVDRAGKQVVLSLNGKPSLKGRRDVTVVPTDDVSKLYYYNRVQDNIDRVNEATDGEVGYVHIPDMGRYGLGEFVKYFYPQISKKALIVDVRGNGGGNVSPMIIERLRREAVMITIARNAEPVPNPSALIYGPMVCIADEFSASDGDIFTYRFKKHGLGKVVGKRTWGGVVGIRGSLPLMDGGELRKPEFSRFDLEGEEWIIEGKGVEPDILVDNDPAREFAGEDQQLEKAIEVILKELETKERKVPEPPPYPEK